MKRWKQLFRETMIFFSNQTLPLFMFIMSESWQLEMTTFTGEILVNKMYHIMRSIYFRFTLSYTRSQLVRKMIELKIERLTILKFMWSGSIYDPLTIKNFLLVFY